MTRTSQLAAVALNVIADDESHVLAKLTGVDRSLLFARFLSEFRLSKMTVSTRFAATRISATG